jgi:hypothetical protein
MGRLQPADWLARLTGPDHTKVKKAVGRVCELAVGDAAFLEVLRAALAQPNENRVFWIVTHLRSLGPSARVAVPELIRLLDRKPAFGTRQALVVTLAALAPNEPAVKEAVFRAFADASPFVRREALQAAIQLTDLTAADLEVIRGMETDPDEGVADWSEIALRNIRLNRQRQRAERSAPPKPTS